MCSVPTRRLRFAVSSPILEPPLLAIKLQAIDTTNNIIMVAINALEEITVPSNIRLLELALLTELAALRTVSLGKAVSRTGRSLRSSTSINTSQNSLL